MHDIHDPMMVSLIMNQRKKVDKSAVKKDEWMYQKALFIEWLSIELEKTKDINSLKELKTIFCNFLKHD